MLGVSESRMYLGGHSLDQVIQGLFLGISLSLLFVHGGLKEIIADLLVKQKENPSSCIINEFSSIYKVNLDQIFMNN